MSNEAVEMKATEKTKKVEDTKIIPKDIDINQFVIVRNGFQGRLVYKSSRTHEKYVWDEFGAEQEIELRELRNAKSSAKGFFINNWFLFDEEYQWVIDYLGLKQYYKNILGIEDFDTIYKKTPSEIEKIINKMSKGQKKSVEYRARQMIANGEIDSIKVISSLEKALGVELVER